MASNNDPRSRNNGTAGSAADLLIDPDEHTGPGFEDSIPRFWKMYASYVIAISYIIGLTLFLQVQSDLTSMQEEVRSLNRYHQQLIHQDEHKRILEQTQKRLATIDQVNEKSMATWKKTVEKLQAEVIDLRETVELPLKKIRRDLGDIQVKVGVMEVRPRQGRSVTKTALSPKPFK